ncbi:hypothetical protein Vretifemale_2764, partial [Volvox reticuliferus]
RRDYLLKLLSATAPSVGDNGDGGDGGGGGGGGAKEAGMLSDSELNRLVARGPEELAFLEAEDEKRQRAVAGAAAGAGGEAAAAVLPSCGRYNRLLPGELCRPLAELAMEANRPKNPDEGKVFG